jgi:hypothetical protein
MVVLVTVVTVVHQEHVDSGRENPVLLGRTDLVSDVECVFDRGEDGRVGTGGDECGEKHVTTGTHPTVESERAHSGDRSVQGEKRPRTVAG